MKIDFSCTGFSSSSSWSQPWLPPAHRKDANTSPSLLYLVLIDPFSNKRKIDANDAATTSNPLPIDPWRYCTPPRLALKYIMYVATLDDMCTLRNRDPTFVQVLHARRPLLTPSMPSCPLTDLEEAILIADKLNWRPLMWEWSEHPGWQRNPSRFYQATCIQDKKTFDNGSWQTTSL